MGADVLGKPLDADHVHRPELVTRAQRRAARIADHAGDRRPRAEPIAAAD